MLCCYRNIDVVSIICLMACLLIRVDDDDNDDYHDGTDNYEIFNNIDYFTYIH
jgi:hypothetical protein